MFPETTVSLDALRALQLERLRAQLSHAYENQAPYRAKCLAASVHPDDLRRLEDLARFPFTSKSDLRDAYPYGMLAIPREKCVRLHASSGTTGRPKGVKYKITRQRVGDQPVEMGMMTAVWGMNGEAVYLSPAPLYHSAPLFYSMSTMRLGGTVITMEHFDPEQSLALIEQYHVTHAQFVPTMFVRMLKLPEEVRNKYDISSLKVVLHAAAPCSIETKRKMID